MNYQNMGASKLSNEQKGEFIKQMKKANASNSVTWNNRANDIGGATVTILKEGSGLNDDELEECWTKAHAMVKDGVDPTELYHLHIDFAGILYFKLPPIKP